MIWNPLELLNIGKSLIDKITPDADKRAELKIELERVHQEGKLKPIEAKVTTIIAEAKSQDKWTSRARPSFMYVMYILILTGLPMGALYAISPGIAENVILGLKAWLEAIPDSLYTLFGVGYVGYTGARSYDKKKTLEATKSNE